MSKSRHSKTKAAGEAAGMNRYGKQFNQKPNVVPAKNRQFRRTESRGR